MSKRSNTFPVIFGVLAVLSLVAMGIGMGISRVVPVPSILVPAGDPDKKLVEQWLRENLDSGKWEEINWWPCSKYLPFNGKRVCGIKLRTANKLGAMTVHGFAFGLSNDNAITILTANRGSDGVPAEFGVVPEAFQPVF